MVLPELLLSPEDEDLRGFYWSINRHGYARLGTKRFGKQPIHQIVAGRMGLRSSLKQPIDHRNRNKLDNRRENLQLTTPRGNWINCDHNENAKGYYQTSAGRWQALIHIDGKTYNLGTFDTEQEASAAYQASKAAGKPLAVRHRFRGYCQHAKSGYWQAYISRNGKQIRLGWFKTEEEARQAREQAEQSPPD